ncbi:hypothetical protein Kpol_1062p1 [Vanderwaltozyma polyspora DSM 70294]|uniref:Spindle pole body component n=1 Tax=Vanderwaltozyma polyspora (strain ATCC 22028 / DSM 70294 / BCRC 21397 / CBS 2163 / NBRC 10782 / NRRL Y-8283 / UCD 57-17) TaxID=436907 RepID=A7TK59_VANPO|nr:uncharacterized protein Kpol_1062p1 [Vanderwaltozyma polyspora DSM 70294]EDO17294.1 hypothetical protein Kpol_1062p1 [Vanderwaltozyma polyspora DSM 70294]
MEVKEVEDNVEFVSPTAAATLLGRQSNYQPLYSEAPKIKSYPLNLLSNASQSRVQEALVVQDLLNVLLGFEGTYIRYNNSYRPDSNVVPEFKIAKMMDPSLKSICNRVVKLGQLYIVLTSASEIWSDSIYGKVLQRLSFEIRQFLSNTYLPFIVDKLEFEFKNNPNFSIRDLEQLAYDTEVYKQMSLLFNIYQKIQEEITLRNSMDRMQEDFNNFMNDLKEQGNFKDGVILVTDTRIQSIPKGGVILKIIQNLVNETLGDRASIDFLRKLLNNISIDYCKMLNDWLVQGELNDICNEFMISDTMKNVDNVASSLKYDDRIWDTQYVVRKDGLLDVFSTSEESALLYKVLMTGKLLNIIKKSYGIVRLPTEELADDVPSFVELMESTNLELYIDKWYNRANQLCLDMYLRDYDLIKFLKLLQKHFFSYHNANNLYKFLQKNMIELTRHYKGTSNNQVLKLQRNFELDRHGAPDEDIVFKLLNLQLDSQPFEKVILSYIGENSYDNQSGYMNCNDENGNQLLRANNFQNLRDILLQEVQSASIEENSSDVAPKTNIHHLLFEILIPYPLNVLVTRTCMVQYQIISRFFNLLQYHSKLLDDTWFEINKNVIWKYRHYPPVVKKNVVQKCRMLHNRMSQFVKVILEYYTQNVIEQEMNKYLNEDHKLNDRKYVVDWQLQLQGSLTNIMTNCCLSQMFQLQLQIFEIIYKFCKFITSMRRRLCQIDPDLHATYLSNSNEEFNEEEVLKTTIPELVNYTRIVSESFEQHTSAFMEGLTHYYHRSRSMNSTNSTSDPTNNNFNTERLIAALGK